MSEILKLTGWKDNGCRLKYSYEDSDLKSLENKAIKLHREIESMNEQILEGKYILKTFLHGIEKDNHYTLKVKIKFHQNKANYEHKENTHRQEIHI